jgi:nucleotide-binding universal stress UspA family protein
MFKHILIPTDGSELSKLAVANGIELAKGMNAKITALHVARPFHLVAFNSEDLAQSLDQYEAHVKTKGREMLAAIESHAKEKGVPCRGSFAIGDHPYETIIKTAEQNGCDLILMASHGRKGVKALLLGSETQKVLTHSSIPVLVYR